MRQLFLRHAPRVAKAMLVAGSALALPLVTGSHRRRVFMEAVPETHLPPKPSLLQEVFSHSGDALIILDLDTLVPAYQQKTDEIIKELQHSFPGLRVVKATREELLAVRPDLTETLNPDSFVVCRSKVSPELEQFDHYIFFMKTPQVKSYYHEIPKINVPNPQAMDKFQIIVGGCEADSVSLPKLKKISQSEEFGSLGVANFQSCEKFGATPRDLILLKKNSKVNSYGDKFLKEINCEKFDVVKIDNYFVKGSQEEKDAKLAKGLSSFSVWAPPGVHGHLESQYTVILSIDHNKITDKERKGLQETMHKIATIFAEKHKDDVTFVYKPISLKNERFRISLMDNQRHSIRMFYKIQNKKPDTAERLLQKYPFLETEKTNTLIYRFDSAHKDFNLTNFKEFFDAARDGKLECFRESAEPTSYKCSKKLVRDNFSKIFSDGKDHLVFFHSSKCHMCKKVSKLFELHSLDNIMSPESKLEFNRVNVTKNSFYPYSPVLAYFKAGQTEPFVYQSQFFNERSLESFINVMKEVSFDATYPDQMAEEMANIKIGQ